MLWRSAWPEPRNYLAWSHPGRGRPEAAQQLPQPADLSSHAVHGNSVKRCNRPHAGGFAHSRDQARSTLNHPTSRFVLGRDREHVYWQHDPADPDLPLIGLFVQILKIPYRLLAPIVVLFCIVGTYSLKSNVYDILIIVTSGFLGFILRSYKFDLAPLIFTMVNCPMMDDEFSPGSLLWLAVMCGNSWAGPPPLSYGW